MAQQKEKTNEIKYEHPDIEGTVQIEITAKDPTDACKYILELGLNTAVTNIYIPYLNDTELLEVLTVLPNISIFTVNGTLDRLDLSYLSHLNNLTSIRILGVSGIDTISFSPLVDVETLYSVTIEECPDLKHLDLSGLENSTLHHLILKCIPIETIDFSPIACNTIDTIIMVNTELKNVDLEPLRKCENLYHLTLFNTKLSEIDVSPLRNSKRLHELSLEKNNIKTIDMTQLLTHNLYLDIANDVELTALDFSDREIRRGLKTISRMEKPKYGDIHR